jgi:hypothetical protein
MIMAEHYDRYYFIGADVTTAHRYWSAFLVVSSLVLMATLRTPYAFAFFGVCALGGIHGLLRLPRADLAAATATLQTYAPRVGVGFGVVSTAINGVQCVNDVIKG